MWSNPTIKAVEPTERSSPITVATACCFGFFGQLLFLGASMTDRYIGALIERQIPSHDYDLVLSDGLLPDGTVMMIADKASEKGTPTLIITGYAYNLRACAPRVISLEIDLSRYDVLQKPLSATQLISAISDRLGHDQPNRARTAPYPGAAFRPCEGAPAPGTERRSSPWASAYAGIAVGAMGWSASLVQ